jgi:hypothetical protein
MVELNLICMPNNVFLKKVHTQYKKTVPDLNYRYNTAFKKGRFFNSHHQTEGKEF